jgi:hypothetical protein
MPPSIRSAAFVSVPFNNFGRFTMTKNVTLTADTDHIGIGTADPPEAPIDH